MAKIGEKRSTRGYEEIYISIFDGKRQYNAWIPTSEKVRPKKKRNVELPDGFDAAHGN